MSGNEWNTQARVLEEVGRSDEEGIPVGAVVIEAWSDEETFVAFNGARYDVAPRRRAAPARRLPLSRPMGRGPTRKGMVDELHARGIKVLLWQIPLVHADRGQARADRRTLIERRYCVLRADGKPYRNRGWWFPGALLPDFTNPDAARWWTEKRRYLSRRSASTASRPTVASTPGAPTSATPTGRDGGETNNRYPVLYASRLPRAAALGGPRPGHVQPRRLHRLRRPYPCHWAGDEDSTWEAFRASITAGLSAGACGIVFWGWDLAGFSGEMPTPELYLRATAAACFCPIMQYHSEYNHHRKPIARPHALEHRRADGRRATCIPIFRRFVRAARAARARISPSKAGGRSRAGKPLMRALFFEVDGDERIWDFPDQ